MNTIVNAKVGKDMNQETNMNTLYMGGCVNQELVAHLSQGVRIFKDYEVYMEIYNKGKEEICEIMKVHEKVEKNGSGLPLVAQLLYLYFFRQKMLHTFLSQEQ